MEVYNFCGHNALVIALSLPVQFIQKYRNAEDSQTYDEDIIQNKRKTG